MKEHTNSAHSSASSSPQNSQVLRKPSFLKAPILKSKYNLELPRFYSSDQKKSKKTLFSQQKQSQSSKEGQAGNTRAGLIKKQSFKYSKTEKNETPTKTSIKTIKVPHSKWDQIYRKSQDSGKQLSRHRSKRIKEKKEAIEEVMLDEPLDSTDVPEKSNPNKIRYKISQHKRQQSDRIKQQKLLPDYAETQPMQKPIKTQREMKVSTQQAPTNSQKSSLSRSLAKNQALFSQYLQESQNEKKKSESTMSKKKSIGQQQIKYLYLVFEVIKESLKNPENLDYPEAYIVTEKLKQEKVLFSLLQEKYHKAFKTHIILTRFSFYLLAHLILIAMNTKAILGPLNKLLQSQLIIIGMLGLSEKKYGHHKVTIQNGMIREKDVGLIVQNRGGNISRNNQIIRSNLEGMQLKLNIQIEQKQN